MAFANRQARLNSRANGPAASVPSKSLLSMVSLVFVLFRVAQLPPSCSVIHLPDAYQILSSPKNG